MRVERWEELKEKMKISGLIENEEVMEENVRHTEILTVKSPSGRMKLEFTIKPKFLGTKTQYSRRIGASVSVKPEYSSDEFVTIFNVFRWDESSQTWIPIDSHAFESS